MYPVQQIQVKPDFPGVFRYIDWLPVEQCLDLPGRPLTYQSEHLARYLGLQNLLISFNGYWPERGASLATGSFKELEVAPVLARIPPNHAQTLVLASAGNTGRAFAQICSTLKRSLCLVVPETSLDAMWSTTPFHPDVCLITVTHGCDYSDAIALARLISQLDGFFPEGGAANVARRDGMGLTVIDAAITLGQIPDHYFQAIGSGTGGISAWEATLRLLADGRYGSTRMKLHLAQNAPFIPVVEAWQAQRLTVPSLDEQIAKEQIAQVSADVLTNRNPAYGVGGGLYEALTDTQGHTYAVSNAESERARKLFYSLEGIDISPAAGVATAALMQAVRLKRIHPQESVLLNITSGGIQRLQRENPLYYLKPSLTFAPHEIRPAVVAERLSDRTPTLSAFAH
jgi:cysteate synthase